MHTCARSGSSLGVTMTTRRHNSFQSLCQPVRGQMRSGSSITPGTRWQNGLVSWRKRRRQRSRIACFGSSKRTSFLCCSFSFSPCFQEQRCSSRIFTHSGWVRRGSECTTIDRPELSGSAPLVARSAKVSSRHYHPKLRHDASKGTSPGTSERTPSNTVAERPSRCAALDGKTQGSLRQGYFQQNFQQVRLRGYA